MTQIASAAVCNAPETSLSTAGYETDSYNWALQQAAALRAGRIEDLDLANLARTLDDLIEQENAKLEAALEQIVDALLKWDGRPEARSRNWALTVHQQRRRITRQIRRQPGLRFIGPQLIERAYATARANVIKLPELYDDTLPAMCPYDWDHLLGREIEWA